jgi:hypothetical protein
MTVNFREFSQELDKMKLEIEKKVSDKIKDIVNEIYDALLEPKFAGGTPKLTGFLRGNWLVTINVPANGPVGSRDNVNTSKRDALIAQFNKYPPEVILSANSIIFNNEVPYGSIVNDGTTSRPGQNFVEKSVQRGFQRLNGVIK